MRLDVTLSRLPSRHQDIHCMASQLRGKSPVQQRSVMEGKARASAVPGQTGPTTPYLAKSHVRDCNAKTEVSHLSRNHQRL